MASRRKYFEAIDHTSNKKMNYYRQLRFSCYIYWRSYKGNFDFSSIYHAVDCA